MSDDTRPEVAALELQRGAAGESRGDKVDAVGTQAVDGGDNRPARRRKDPRHCGSSYPVPAGRESARYRFARSVATPVHSPGAASPPLRITIAVARPAEAAVGQADAAIQKPPLADLADLRQLLVRRGTGDGRLPLHEGMGDGQQHDVGR